ncbi:hypothetical protein HMN09_00545900 [Mycena chlorophos]|uniref:Apple domain-containing protein n=1 Tax=Mycena chlorophos TaxID=658473 RepID=A0A8H6TAI6_MYCCL|nr:hypothetical protein HMN09_00545900 [Mycena chlorophos]
MHFSFTALKLVALATFALHASAQNESSVATAFTVSSDEITTALKLTAGNHYNCPLPPWEKGSEPGWHYGHSSPPPHIPCLKHGNTCSLLEILDQPGCFHCPPKSTPPEYTKTFSNLTCAAQDDSYLTYGLTDTVEDCQTMCDAVDGCTFINTYHDNNAADKDYSPLLTCALFSKCLTASSADNCGGQGQPDGGIEFITQSYGYCKKKPTST